MEELTDLMSSSCRDNPSIIMEEIKKIDPHWNIMIELYKHDMKTKIMGQADNKTGKFLNILQLLDIPLINCNVNLLHGYTYLKCPRQCSDTKKLFDSTGCKYEFVDGFVKIENNLFEELMSWYISINPELDFSPNFVPSKFYFNKRNLFMSVSTSLYLDRLRSFKDMHSTTAYKDLIQRDPSFNLNLILNKKKYFNRQLQLIPKDIWILSEILYNASSTVQHKSSDAYIILYTGPCHFNFTSSFCKVHLQDTRIILEFNDLYEKKEFTRMLYLTSIWYDPYHKAKFISGNEY